LSFFGKMIKKLKAILEVYLAFLFIVVPFVGPLVLIWAFIYYRIILEKDDMKYLVWLFIGLFMLLIHIILWVYVSMGYDIPLF